MASVERGKDEPHENTIAFAEAKARLSALVDRVEAGDTISITRHGKVVARLVPAEKPRQPFNFERVRKLREGMRYQEQSAGDFMREMRDEERY